VDIGRLRWLLEPLPLVLVAAVVGLVAPSPSLADRADLILAALVLAVALTIEPRRVRAAFAHWQTVAVLSFLPFVTLLPLALALGALFDSPEREGLLALGLASTEVATAGLVALAGGDAALALAVVSVSLVGAALVAPIAAPLLAEGGGDPGELLVRFSLVVLVPLALGLALRSGGRGRAVEPVAERAATVILAVLVYAALGDVEDRSELGTTALAAALFLAGSAVIALALRAVLGDRRTGPFTFALRDFAVAAALASQFDAPGAASTAAVYGVLMLVVAVVATELLRRRPSVPASG
jgi:predicted Na+-dependent transporter